MTKVFAIALLGVGVSLADPLTWTLHNVTFTDGGVATGSFVFDSSTNTLVSYSISVSGGDTTTFPAFTYQNGTAHNLGGHTLAGTINLTTDLAPSGFAPRELRLPVLPLPSTGGVVNLNLANGFQGECYNCVPSRTFASGQVTNPQATSVPALPPGGLVLTAVLLMAAGALVLRSAQRTVPD
jgi:hypothetical protein